MAPGISRSGATIAMGLLLGLRRPAAARFSFLLSIPIVAGAGMVKVLDWYKASHGQLPALSMAVGFVAAAVAGFLAIHFLLTFVQRHKLYVFAGYCALVGAGSLALMALGVR